MSGASLRHEYLPVRDLSARPAEWWASVLGVVGFDDVPPIAPMEIPVTASMTPALGTDDVLCEVWRVAGTAVEQRMTVTARHRRVIYRFCDQFLFGSVSLEEGAMARAADEDGSSRLMRATEMAYREIFELLAACGHRHLIRVWNYLPEINREAGGGDRYRQFNSARRAAFQRSGQALAGSVPAACALGSSAGNPLSIFFLAGRHAPTAIENPRQVSAYHYPPRYGEHRPIFSRACLLHELAGTTLFVSGTASILGHETVHHGDVAAQTREALANVAALLREANRIAGAARYAMDTLRLKVYVRHPRDLTAVMHEVARVVAHSTPVIYLRADVCRTDLLMEIEATGEAAAAPGHPPQNAL